MHKYAILYNPGHNRVYFKQSVNLAASELMIASNRVAARLSKVENMIIAGIEYMTFSTDSELSRDDIKIISNLSFTYAIYELSLINKREHVGDGQEDSGCERQEDAADFDGVNYHLIPVNKITDFFIDENVSSILKYTGKTNEIFTRMLINVAYYSQNNAHDVKLLDPVAGKCTTLFEGLIKGFDVYGIEIGDKAAAEAYNYLKKFLETEKYKHKTVTMKVSGPGKSFKSTKYAFEIAKTKIDQKDRNTRTAEIIAGNSVNINAYYKKDTFDLIVGDLPYGVQHGSVTNQKQSSLTRNPTELLESCLPAWIGTLKPGGVVALSWNTLVLRRELLGRILTGNGLSLKNDAAYAGFAHRVDQSITRDIIVAQKI